MTCVCMGFDMHVRKHLSKEKGFLAFRSVSLRAHAGASATVASCSNMVIVRPSHFLQEEIETKAVHMFCLMSVR